MFVFISRQNIAIIEIRKDVDKNFSRLSKIINSELIHNTDIETLILEE